MGRYLKFLIGLAVLALGVGAALPLYLPLVAEMQGIGVAKAFWTDTGLALQDVKKGAVQAEYVLVNWDRSIELTDPVVQLSSGGASSGLSSGGSSGRSSSLPSGIKEVRVRNLRLEGTPIPLPLLSGTVLPVRSLQGEGVWIEGSTASLSLESPYGMLQLTASKAETGGYQLQASCTPCRLVHAVLEDQALLVPVKVDGTLLTEGAVFFEGTVQAGEEERAVSVGVKVERPAGPLSKDSVFTGSFSLQGVELSMLYGLLSSLIPEVSRAQIEGSLSVEGRFQVQNQDISVELSSKPVLSKPRVDGLVGSRYQRGKFRFAAKNAEGKQITLESGEGTPGWLAMAQISPFLPAAVVSAEDGRFYEHRGYDIDSMLEAAQSNEEGGRLRGGSTLTQQLAKNLFLDGERSYIRKLREFLYAIELDRELGKNRLLEIYLNIIEWGPDIRGIDQACRTYFLKSPANLLPEEAAWLAAIIREPKTAWKRQYLVNQPNTARIHHILVNMHGVPEEEIQAALLREVHLVPPPR